MNIKKISCQKIPFKDKGCHIIAGFFISLLTGLFLGPLGGFLIGAAFGVLKEVYDKLSGRGVADIKDIAATILGSLGGSLLVCFV